MAMIGWKDVVNKSDERIVLEPGDSIECGVKLVGDELRLESLPGIEETPETTPNES